MVISEITSQEKNNLRKTKIICTLGPATSSKDMIKKLALAGMDIARLNFSHGTAQEHKRHLQFVRKISQEIGKPLGVLQDLEGYKIRTGPLEKGKKVFLKEGDFLDLVSENKPGNNREVSISYPQLYKFVKPGDRIFIDDGNIELKIKKVSPGKITTRVITAGPLGERKGIHVPGVNLEFPCLTEKDKQDIRTGIELGVDYIAQSFVRSAKDIDLIKNILKKEKREEIKVLAKIEDSKGVENIEEIIQVANGIMIARGDMGVCLPRAQVPLIQKMIIRKCNQMGKPVITATQMLDSMIRNHQPTRAEVADVANAIMDGTDLLMLSGETAIGLYPEEAVKEMHRIAVTCEASLKYEELLKIREIPPPATIADSIGFVTRQLAELVKANVIVVFTLSGNTARIVSKYRPRARIIALTPDLPVAKELILYWGVEVLTVTKVDNIETHYEVFLEELVKKNLIKKGELVVLTSGIKKELDKPSGNIKMISI